MTGAGAPGAAGILKCLKQDPNLHIYCGDANANAIGSHMGFEFSILPMGTDTSFPERLIEICKEKNIHVVLPLVTKELLPLANNFERFAEAGVKLLVSPAPSLEIANNKSRLYEFLQWRDIPIPAFQVIENAEQLDEALITLGYPEKNVTIKPSVSNGSRGFRIISKQFDALAEFLEKKPGTTFSTREEILSILKSGVIPEMLVSEYLPGDEYSVDCLANHGNTIIALPRKREKISGGISVAGRFEKNEAIIHYCTRIISELKLHGNIGLQVKANEKGDFLLLEINPRVQGSISSTLGAGINLPLLAIRQELGELQPVDLPEPVWGIRFQKYWEEVFY